MAKIMLVDDALFVRETMAAFLKHNGHEVTCKSSGNEALEKYKKGTYDLILMDCSMPGFSGIHTIKKIKKKDPEVKILMVSAVVQQHIMQKAIDAGAQGFIGKPVNPQDLLKKIIETVSK